MNMLVAVAKAVVQHCYPRWRPSWSKTPIWLLLPL